MTTYSDAVYVSFRNENDAVEAANYFHGLQLRNSLEPLESFYLDRCLALGFATDRDPLYSQMANSALPDEALDSAEYYEPGRKRFRNVQQANVECEILVNNRQLKFDFY